jgi:hypothetical protein
MSQKVSRNAPCPCGSGKKYKNCCWSTYSVRAITSPADAGIEQIFGTAGQVELTEALITELAGRGWEERGLRSAREAGAVYSTVRNSLIFPPGVMWSPDD